VPAIPAVFDPAKQTEERFLGRILREEEREREKKKKKKKKKKEKVF